MSAGPQSAPSPPPASAPPARPPAVAPHAQSVFPPPARPAPRIMALRLAVYYLMFGLIWITASDLLASHLPQVIQGRFQTLKGFAFIFITAGLLYFLIRHYLRSLQNAQQQHESRLQAIADQYQRLFERNPSAMIIFNPVSRQILAANDVALLLYGYSREKLLAMKTLQLVVDEQRRRAGDNPAYQTDTVQNTGPWQIRRGDGRLIYVEGITHLIEFSGVPARIATVVDVTERLEAQRSLAQYHTQLEYRVTERTAELSQANRQLQEEIELRRQSEREAGAARQAAETADQAKSSLLAQTSHEIRTPLTSLLGYADLLADESLTADESARYLELVTHNAQHMLALVEDLMDFSRVQTGRARIMLADHFVREIARQAVDLLHPRALRLKLALLLRVSNDLPETLRTDGVRLRQILLNLLNNGLKFTQAGSVTLAVVFVPSADGAADSIRFDIADTGVGMNADQLDRIFEPFYQIEHHAERRAGGLGLGLTISRQLARQLGGDLCVASTPGQGTTFSLTLPVSQSPGPVPLPAAAPARDHAAPALRAAAAAPPALRDFHILLAEDTDNIRLLVDEYLTRAGARVTAVGDGAQALRHVNDSLSPGAVRGQAFDLILLDLQMPVMGGSEALAGIRAAGYSGPIVGLTAGSAEKSTEDWLAAGWTAVAAKPIDRQAFIPLLARLITENRQAVTS